MVLKGMSRLCDRIVVAIGSSRDEWTTTNPFSAGERREMIQRALQDENIIPQYDVTLVDVPDVPSDQDWIRHLQDVAGEDMVVWTGNKDTEACCVAAGITVKQIKEVPGISATLIRERIKNGEDWRSLVPPSVASYIEEIGGAERIKEGIL